MLTGAAPCLAWPTVSPGSHAHQQEIQLSRRVSSVPLADPLSALGLYAPAGALALSKMVYPQSWHLPVKSYSLFSPNHSQSQLLLVLAAA